MHICETIDNNSKTAWKQRGKIKKHKKPSAESIKDFSINLGYFLRNPGDSWTFLWLPVSPSNAISPEARVLTSNRDQPINYQWTGVCVFSTWYAKEIHRGPSIQLGSTPPYDLLRKMVQCFYSWRFYDVACNSNLTMPSHLLPLLTPHNHYPKKNFTLESDLGELKLVVLKAP